MDKDLVRCLRPGLNTRANQVFLGVVGILILWRSREKSVELHHLLKAEIRILVLLKHPGGA